jgi:nitric oxide reductase large subunit
VGSQRLNKVAVAIGGFLIFVGIIMTGVFALVLSGVVDVSVFEGISGNEAYRMLFLGVLLVIGILDFVSGIMLRRR